MERDCADVFFAFQFSNYRHAEVGLKRMARLRARLLLPLEEAGAGCIAWRSGFRRMEEES